MGLYLAAGGGWLAALGGSLFYLIAGIALIATGVCCSAPARSRSGSTRSFCSERWRGPCGRSGSTSGRSRPAGGSLVLLGIWLLMPWFARDKQFARRPRLALLGTLVLAFLAVGVSLVSSVHDTNGSLPRASAGSPPQFDLASQPESDWQAYGRGGSGDRYSPLNADHRSQREAVETRLDLPHRRHARPQRSYRNNHGGHADQGKPHGVSVLAASDRLRA